MSNIKANPQYTTFVDVKSSLLADLQKSGLTPEQVTSEFFNITVMLAASACTDNFRLNHDQVAVAINHFIAALNDEIASSGSIEASHARVVRSFRIPTH
jgi:hypothetical protein